MVKFLYNRTYGGFGFSTVFFEKYKEVYGEELERGSCWFAPYDRTDEKLIKIVEMISCKASSSDHCSIGIVDVDEKLIQYADVDEYDGKERVYINWNDAFRQLLDDVITYGSLTDEHKVKYDMLNDMKRNYRITELKL